MEADETGYRLAVVSREASGEVVADKEQVAGETAGRIMTGSLENDGSTQNRGLIMNESMTELCGGCQGVF